MMMIYEEEKMRENKALWATMVVPYPIPRDTNFPASDVLKLSQFYSLVSMETSSSQSSAKPLLDQTELLSLYRPSQRCLFLLDYDGTLTPMVANPQAAIPSDELLCTLRPLVSNCKDMVWVISGRDQAILDQFLGQIVQIGLAAEHGAIVRYPGVGELGRQSGSELAA